MLKGGDDSGRRWTETVMGVVGRCELWWFCTKDLFAVVEIGERDLAR